MNSTKAKILNYIQIANKEISTSEIVKFIYSKEIEIFNSLLSDSFQDVKKIKNAKKKIAKYHRKILYYLNELIKENKIIVSKIGNKNKKHFIAVEKEVSSTQTLNKNRVLPIEGYLEKGIITKHKPRFWFECFDTIVLDASKFISLQELLKATLSSFNRIKDVVAINNFETILQTCKLEDIEKTIKKMMKDSVDFDRKICFIFDATNFHPSYNYKETILKIIEILSENKEYSEKISVIFDFNVKELNLQREFFEDLFEIIKENGYKVYFKNNEIWKPIYVVAGSVPYTLSIKDWKLYKSKIFGSSRAFVLSQSTLYVNIKKFIKKYGKTNTKEFRRMFNNILKSLLYSNNLQRKLYNDMDEELKTIFGTSYDYSPFILGKNYIRFNNFLWDRNCDEKNIEFSLNMLKSLTQEAENFCHNEETIYISCGMPIRFDVALSNASREFLDEIEDSCFNSIEINNIKNFYDESKKKVISKKEQLFKIFAGGDNFTIKRIGKADKKELINELTFIFNTFNLPLICYDFENNIKKEKKLTEFIKWK